MTTYLNLSKVSRLLPVVVVVWHYIFHIQITQGIECYECGLFNVLPKSSDHCKFSMFNSTVIDTCDYQLVSEFDNGSDDDDDDDDFQLQSSTYNPICYTLVGKFRGQELVMRGCDSSAELQDKCYDSSYSVWFETERGREYITESTYCICSSDFCNFESSGAPMKLQTSIYFIIIGFHQVVQFKNLAN